MDKLGVIFEAGRFETLFGAATSGSSSSVLKGDTAAGLRGSALGGTRKNVQQAASQASGPADSSIAAARAASASAISKKLA